MATRYVVKGDEMLGYITEGLFPGLMHVLADKSGQRQDCSWCSTFSENEIRDATPADFEFFRVDAKGYFPPEVLNTNPLWGTF